MSTRGSRGSPNLRPHSGGWQKYTRVRGALRTEWTHAQPTAQQVRDWVRLQHAAVKFPERVLPDPGERVFERLAVEYLDSVAAMPSLKDRTLHLAEWCDVFAGRDPDSVSALEIQTVLAKLHKRLSGGSCNRRRTALMSFYTAINGKSGYNPVRDVPKYREDAEPRGAHPLTILRVLSFLEPSKTRTRLHVLLWTGWPHAQLARLKPGHLDLRHARAYVTPRRKGKGVKGRWLPLLPQAVRALQRFADGECFGAFSTSAMHSTFARGLAKLNAHRARLQLPPVQMRPYDLRHTFGTWLAERVTDERALQEIMLHSRAEQTRRYTERATQARVKAAIALASGPDVAEASAEVESRRVGSAGK